MGLVVRRLGADFQVAGIELERFQPAYALDFYEVATGRDANGQLSDAPAPEDVLITGHSLGGSLAGFDDRVDPWHARRFANRLLEAEQAAWLRTAGTGGHGGGDASHAQAANLAARAVFFRRTLLARGGVRSRRM